MKYLIFAAALLMSTTAHAVKRDATVVGADGTALTGTVPVGSGGTGATSLSANGVLAGNGTSAVQVSTNVKIVPTGMTIGNGTNISTITPTGLFELTSGSTMATRGTFAISTSPTAGTTTKASIVVNQNAGVSVFGDNAGLNAPVGYVGEYVSLAAASNIDVSGTGAYVDLSTITLTAGDWDISGSCELQLGGTTAATAISCGITGTIRTLDTLGANALHTITGVPSVSSVPQIGVGPYRVSITATTTYYLVGAMVYSVGGGAIWESSVNFISARRMR